MNADAMSDRESNGLYLPKADRSFWRRGKSSKSSLLYLAWGYRNFQKQPIPVSCHDGVVCVLIEEGCPILTVNGHPLLMQTNTFALISADCAFGWSQSGKEPCKFLLWMWHGFADSELREISKKGHSIRALNRKQCKFFALLHDLCRREVLRPEGPDSGFIDGCRMIFETTLKRSIQGNVNSQQQTSELIQQVKSWMRMHLASKEPVARLCDYVNLSQSTLYRLFKAEVGVSPLAHFHQLRMQKANDLLVCSRLSIKEIAFQLGYEHFNDFSRAYRKYFGHSPTSDRNSGCVKSIFTSEHHQSEASKC